MGWIRLVILGLVVWLVYKALKSFLRPNKENNAHKSTKVDYMVACKQCGVHLPRENAVICEVDDTFFCSVEHKNSYESEKNSQ